ncbi:ATP-binding cassette domain-containing protein [Labrys wisconsinensis]|uniref:Simple sugar transport system ATP-binding protein n=1 Tax=Labrys wisconsinensis TaxID=425677 RepID=A0ABU0JH16_9HYPH|nr:ATP-binding cassette domain-containing protein [Labrys wisconsinensis]MDQ0473589.1 simple sugar transport system ATP-binding protein [Labrys wisconsinensis]
MTPFLEVRNVSKSFGGIAALKGISFELAAGEAVALMGGNGAGKSTLVSLLSGLLRPDIGSICIEGADRVLSDPQQSREAGIETVFQNLALCPNLNAPGNLFLGRELYRGFGPFKILDRKAMEKVTVATLQDLGVNVPDMRAPTNRFSGGQRQALAFARAVRGKSKLLILDEPTAALGVEESANVVKTVQRLRKERNIAVLLITHNLEEMRSIADKAVVLRRGHHVGSVLLKETSDDEIVARITGSFGAKAGVAA